MVAAQLAQRGIRDRRVLAVMARVPREWFLPPHLHAEAYEDTPLPIGSGQTISQPYIVALMTAALAPRRRDRVLEIGTGSGYQAAILAHLARRVYTIERRPDLLVEAEERFRRLGLTNIETRLGDGAAGWPEEAPCDGVLGTAARSARPRSRSSRRRQTSGASRRSRVRRSRRFGRRSHAAGCGRWCRTTAI